MAKYRLKKDTPNFRAGELFTVHLAPDKIFPQDSDAIYDPHGDYYDSRGNINDFFDWFEKVEEGVEWLHDGVIYYHPAVDRITDEFVPAFSKYYCNSPDKARRRIGICYKSRESCRRFIDFLTAVEVVSHDEGFMTRSSDGLGFAIHLKDDGQLGATVTSNELAAAFRQHAGEFYFDTEKHAKASGEKHPNEWQTILNYDWSRE